MANNADEKPPQVQLDEKILARVREWEKKHGPVVFVTPRAADMLHGEYQELSTHPTMDDIRDIAKPIPRELDVALYVEHNADKDKVSQLVFNKCPRSLKEHD